MKGFGAGSKQFEVKKGTKGSCLNGLVEVPLGFVGLSSR